jgi:hypothetical protein
MNYKDSIHSIDPVKALTLLEPNPPPFLHTKS